VPPFNRGGGGGGEKGSIQIEGGESCIHHFSAPGRGRGPDGEGMGFLLRAWRRVKKTNSPGNEKR